MKKEMNDAQPGAGKIEREDAEKENGGDPETR